MGTIYTKGDVRINVLPRHQKEKKNRKRRENLHLLIIHT